MNLRTCTRKESFTFFVSLFEKLFLYQCAVYKQRCTQKGGIFNGGAGDRISKRSVVTFAPPVSQNLARLGANGGRPLLNMKGLQNTCIFTPLTFFYTVYCTVLSKSTESYYYSRIPHLSSVPIATFMYEYLFKAYTFIWPCFKYKSRFFSPDPGVQL